jgi:ribonucleoside-triphosphate reductase
MDIQIKTNDGHVEKFNKAKIVDALLKDHNFMVDELKTTNGIDNDTAKNIAGRVTRLINKLSINGKILSSDTIRGLVSTELIEKEYFNLLNVTELVGLRVSDIYKITRGSDDNDNANLTPNPETSHKLIADNLMKKYYLRIFPENVAKAHIMGDIHIHDMEYFGTRPFCRSWDLRRFFYDGFSPDGENNGIVATAPKHAEVAILQATKVLAMGQCNHAGGQGLLYGTVFLAPYMMGKTYKEIKQLMQMMLYELNQMYISRGGQTIFSSINISPGCPKVLENVPIVYNGKIDNTMTYKDLEREIRLQFQALMELCIEGDASGKLFPFPKLEVAIEKKFVDENTWNNKYTLYGEDESPSYKELYELAFEVVAKTGILYFDNLLPEKKNADEGVGCTQCCSYSFATDKESDNDFEKELMFKDGYFFRLGGMQACSINLPRIAYQSKNDIKILMALIFNNMDICAEVFKVKKDMINANIHRLRYLTQTGKRTVQLTDFDKLVYEIGIVGLNEMLQEFCGYQIGENQVSYNIYSSRLIRASLY